ncbi:MAG TPA: HD domain-containing phosphohydrolase [Acidimicrobiales bacterium]|nr:HD domain-containing phosphohydrolase [Acidimicrobiales bacterium]HUB71777.1 HD domain-containing phosphohydrolase [Acidimicrobiales bacterium]
MAPPNPTAGGQAPLAQRGGAPPPLRPVEGDGALSGTPPDLSVTAAARARVHQLLTEAARRAGGDAGAVYGASGDNVQLVAPLMDAVTWLAPGNRQLAQTALRARRPVTAEVQHHYDGRLSGSTEGCVAIPLEVAGDAVGVLLVSGLPLGPAPLDGHLASLGQLPEVLALSLDRLRLVLALEERGQEVSSLSRQLDAFALDFRSTYEAERERSQQLADTLAELGRTYRATVGALAMAVEAKDERTGGHLYRVTRYGMLLTSLVAPDHADDHQFEYGFLLHDIGKLMVPDAVLNKAGALSDAEWDVMRAHPTKGCSILEGVPFLDVAREIVYCHHERWDGNGYPRGLREMEIPLGARLFPLCDAFDAMTSDRPYRPAMSFGEALARIRDGSGTQFWAEAVSAFMTIPAHELEAIAFQSKER